MIEILDKKKHNRKDFDGGNNLLTNYLKKQANQDVKRKLSACFVLVENDTGQIKGYYTLSNRSIPLKKFPVKIRKNKNKKLVVVGIEKKKKGVSRLYAKVIPDAGSVSLGEFMKYHINPSANIKTDLWTGYKPLEKDFENLVRIPSGKKGENFPEMHRAIMNLKEWLRGMHHQVRDLQDYLDEYCYRFNRSFMKEGIFENLMTRMVNTKPCYIKNISN